MRVNRPVAVQAGERPRRPTLIRQIAVSFAANVLRRCRLRKLKGLFPGVPMAASKVPFGEDPLDRRHRGGGGAETCPRCGARQRPGENRCWFCESRMLPLAGFEPVTDKEAADPLAASHLPRSSLQFSLGTILLVTTLVAICLAITLATTPLGISVCVIAVGGLIRTTIIGWAQIRAGRRFEMRDKLANFVGSSIVFLIALVSGISTSLLLAGGALFLADILRQLAEPIGAIALFAAIPAAVVAGVLAFARLYLTFDPFVREQIAATPEQQRLNQMSGTVYRHRPR
jgi:hypothetical protein